MMVLLTNFATKLKGLNYTKLAFDQAHLIEAHVVLRVEFDHLTTSSERHSIEIAASEPFGA